VAFAHQRISLGTASEASAYLFFSCSCRRAHLVTRDPGAIRLHLAGSPRSYCAVSPYATGPVSRLSGERILATGSAAGEDDALA